MYVMSDCMGGGSLISDMAMLTDGDDYRIVIGDYEFFICQRRRTKFGSQALNLMDFRRVL